MKCFRDKIEDFRRSLEPRQLSQEDYINSIVNSMTDDVDVFAEAAEAFGYKNQPATNISQEEKWRRRREEESRRIQQQIAEHNFKLDNLRLAEYFDDNFLKINVPEKFRCRSRQNNSTRSLRSRLYIQSLSQKEIYRHIRDHKSPSCRSPFNSIFVAMILVPLFFQDNQKHIQEYLWNCKEHLSLNLLHFLKNQ